MAPFACFHYNDYPCNVFSLIVDKFQCCKSWRQLDKRFCFVLRDPKEKQKKLKFFYVHLSLRSICIIFFLIWTTSTLECFCVKLFQMRLYGPGYSLWFSIEFVWFSRVKQIWKSWPWILFWGERVLGYGQQRRGMMRTLKVRKQKKKNLQKVASFRKFRVKFHLRDFGSVKVKEKNQRDVICKRIFVF